MKKQNNKIILSIIIITHNNENCIKKCLNSLNKYIIDIECEVFLIDNNSNDNTVNILKNFKDNNKKFKITILENKKNIGISKSRNQGIRKSHGDYILFLDSDAYLIDNSIKIGMDFLKNNKDIGICIPKMYYENMEIQDNIRHFPTLNKKIKSAFNGILHKISKKKDINNFSYTKLTKELDIFEIDYGIGAYMLIKKDVVDSIGLFDEKIFYGPEDADYCLRAYNNGFKVYYNSYVSVIHERQRLSYKKTFSKINFYHIQGLCHYFCKHKYLFKVKKRIEKTNYSN